MTRKHYILPCLLGVGFAFATSGCAMLTAKTVGTVVAKQVGKKVVKDMKEDHDQKKAEEERRTAQAHTRAD